MLEYPVEDAQIAEEAVLRAQVARGRIADAVRTAQRARIRSIEYEQKLLGILETARRDVQQVDWVHEVLGLLEQARQHLDERLATERELIAAVEARLEAAQGPAVVFDGTAPAKTGGPAVFDGNAPATRASCWAPRTTVCSPSAWPTTGARG